MNTQFFQETEALLTWRYINHVHFDVENVNLKNYSSLSKDRFDIVSKTVQRVRLGDEELITVLVISWSV